MFMRPKPAAILNDSALKDILPRAELMRLSKLATSVNVAAGEEVIARATHTAGSAS